VAGGLAVSCTLLALTVLLAVAATAQASTTYVPGGTIEGFGFPLGGVAVENSTGDLYVVDGKEAVVDKYDASGTLISHFGEPCPEAPAPCGDGQFGQSFFVGASGIAVDQTTGDVYVTDNVNNRVEKFNSAGTYLSQFDGSATPAGNFSTPTSVAVDPTDGSVYVVDAGNGVVDKFDSSGAVATGFGTGGSIGGFSFPTFGSQPSGGVAVDSSGRLYVGDPGNGVVDEFDSSGAFQGQLGAGTLSAPSELAVDSADNVFAVDSSSQSIVEFDSGGNQLLSFPTGASTALRGIAVAGDGTHLYLSTTAGFGGSSEVTIFVRVTLPDVTTGAASNQQQTAATLNGTVNPDGVALNDCHFAYTDEADFLANGFTGPDAKTASCVPDAASIPADHSDHRVTADLTGLSPNTTYDFRLVAANANGAAHGQDLTFRTPGPPVIDSTSVADVTSGEATVKAQVNPESSDTAFHIEYGSTTAYGTTAPVPDGDLGAGSSDVAVSQQLTGLQPSTTYHFRVVAVNAFGTTDGPDQALVTYPSAPSGLPDGRGYELVTPSDDLGNDIGPAGTGAKNLTAAVAADGQHVFYKTSTLGAFGEPPNGLAGAYLAARGAAGWTSVSVTPPSALHPEALSELAEIVDASTDFSTLFDYGLNSIDPNDQNGVFDVYARGPEGSFSWISQNGAVETAPVSSVYVGRSADAGHVLFQTAQALTPDDAGQLAGEALYERADGKARLVGVTTNGALTSACGAAVVLNAFGAQPTDRAISADGSRVFFESPDPEGTGDPSCSPAQGGTQPVELYLRQSAATTTEVSVSQRAGSVGVPAPDGAEYAGASVDGSSVFFTSQDQLTEDAPVSQGCGRTSVTCDLYRYDVPSGRLTFIATGRPLTPQAGPVEGGGVPAISADGSHVYFVGEAAGGPSGQAGLYLWDEGQISYISPAPSEEEGRFLRLQAEASADGSTLAFTSTGDLTGFRAHGHREVYVYTAAGPGISASFACVSCAPNGLVPTGDAFLALHTQGVTRSNRAITADGSRIFFSSPDPLLPQATNGLRNVYEYEHGVLHLLSDGNGPYETELVGASSDGNDVIIDTRDSLVPQDTDEGGGDLYDVRVGGGFPPSVAPTQCSGEGCQGVQPTTPSFATPPSATFNGLGNLTPTVSSAKPAPKPLTRAQKLAKALRACGVKHNRHKRAICRAQARKRYGASKAKKSMARKLADASRRAK
jgi:DNA-binding beta-propeller fold protein YncE